MTEYPRELNMADGGGDDPLQAGGVEFERTAFSSPRSGDCAAHCSEQAGTTEREFMDGWPASEVGGGRGRQSPVDDWKGAKHIAGAGHPGSEKPVVLSDVPGEGMYYATVLEAKVEGGHVAANGNKLGVQGATACTIVLAMATGYRGFDRRPTCRRPGEARAIRQLDAALKKSYPSCGNGTSRITATL